MLISVIIPCYMQAHFLGDALTSVLDQSFSEWECLVVNDGGTDNAEDIVNQFIQRDKRFSYYFKENGGLPSARNFGILKAKGSLILPLDADDKLSANYLLECYNTLIKTNATLVYGGVEFFGAKTGSFDFGDYNYQDLLFTNMIHCSAMFSKKMWSRLGGYDESLKDGLEDWEFYIRLLDETAKVVKLNTVFLFYRQSEHSMISKMSKKKELAIKQHVFIKHNDIYFKAYQQLGKLNKEQRQLLSEPVKLLKRGIKLIMGSQ